jgi:hypothetical protein
MNIIGHKELQHIRSLFQYIKTFTAFKKIIQYMIHLKIFYVNKSYITHLNKF